MTPTEIQASVEAAPARDYTDLLAIVQPTLDTQPTNIDIKLQLSAPMVEVLRAPK